MYSVARQENGWTRCASAPAAGEFSSLCDTSSKTWSSPFPPVPPDCSCGPDFCCHSCSVGHLLLHPHWPVQGLGCHHSELLQGLKVLGTRVAVVILSAPPCFLQFICCLLPYFSFHSNSALSYSFIKQECVGLRSGVEGPAVGAIPYTTKILNIFFPPL